jgi:hypothetical protein
MPTYSISPLVLANSKHEEDLWVEGDRVSYISISFPPGSQGLLKVGIFYGEKKIWPYEEDQWFNGDDTTIDFEEDWPLPENPCRLIVKAVNEDDVYEHMFFLRLRTSSAATGSPVSFRVTPEGFVEVMV